VIPRCKRFYENFPPDSFKFYGKDADIFVNGKKIQDCETRVYPEIPVACIEGDGVSMDLMKDTSQPQDLKHRLQQQELDLIHLNCNLELANQELDRALQRQKAFLSNTSHELRTPLNAILSFLRLVLDGLCDSPEEARQFVQNAYDSARSLLDFTNEHLDNASLEAKKLDLQLTEVNVAAVFAQVEKLAMQEADQKEVRLTFRPPRTRLLVRGDPVQLPQALLNLMTDAVKSISKGEVRVQARSWRDKGHVRFQVLVTGKGLTPENPDNLIHKFQQAKGSVKRQDGGSGLELGKTLVECMGGQIWLSNSTIGRRTSIFFTLPLVTPQPLYWRRTTDRERGLEVQGPPTGPLILLVEDEPKVLNKIARILQKHGYRTAFAVTADDGLEGAKRLLPALITIDLGLPVRPLGVLHSGMNLYQALKQDAQLSGIPVILVTGHDPTLTQTTLPLPPILSKPFRAQQLLDQISDRLAGLNRLSVQRKTIN
jgi:signal transduction histidine kinase/CheY-like chemotaxis protein